MLYETLDNNGQIELLHARVRELEADHFRQMLLLIEVEHDPVQASAAQARLDELERRIIRHIGPPEERQPAAADDGKADGADLPDAGLADAAPDGAPAEPPPADRLPSGLIVPPAAAVAALNGKRP